VEDDAAVLVLELPDAPVDMTPYSRVEFDAVMSGSRVMSVVFNGPADEPEGCGWDIYPVDAEEGMVTYSIAPALLDWCQTELRKRRRTGAAPTLDPGQGALVVPEGTSEQSAGCRAAGARQTPNFAERRFQRNNHGVPK
jgi:hypothetical protein